MTPPGSDLIEAYALGALTDDERKLAELVIATDPDARRRLETAMSTLDTLDDLVTEDVAPPNDDLLDRIRIAAGIDSAVEDTGVDRGNVLSFGRPRSRRFRGFLAIAAVIALVVLGGRVIQLDAENASLREDLASPLDSAADAALADPQARLVTLTAPAGNGDVVSVDVVYLPDGTGYLIGESLPALDADRTYQLWAIVGDRVISAGVMGSDPGVAPFQVVGSLAGLALTDEVAGGVVTSQEQPVALWLAEA